MTEISGKVSSVMPQITAGAVTVKGKDGKRMAGIT